MKQKISVTFFPLSRLLWINSDTVEVADFVRDAVGMQFSPLGEVPEDMLQWVKRIDRGDGGPKWYVIVPPQWQEDTAMT